MPLLSKSHGAAFLALVLITSGCASLRPVALPGGPSSPVLENNGQPVRMTGGGLAGNLQGLSASQRRQALDAEYRALEFSESRNPERWSAEQGSASGTVVAFVPFQVGSQNCRQFSHKVLLDGREQTLRGGACRNADGTWTPLV